MKETWLISKKQFSFVKIIKSILFKQTTKLKEDGPQSGIKPSEFLNGQLSLAGIFNVLQVSESTITSKIKMRKIMKMVGVSYVT